MTYVLTIGGSDTGTESGIQKDLQVIRDLGLNGVSVITSVTAQNNHSVDTIFPLPPNVIKKQFRTAFKGYPVAAVKIGMLYDKQTILILSDLLKPLALPIVLDPVLFSTSGFRLLKKNDVPFLLKYMFPLCTVVTPNRGESETFSGLKISSEKHIPSAALIIRDRYKTGEVLIKGGHFRNSKYCTDYLTDGNDIIPFRSIRYRKKIRGSGCALSAAIACFLAKKYPLSRAVKAARKYISECFLSENGSDAG